MTFQSKIHFALLRHCLLLKTSVRACYVVAALPNEIVLLFNCIQHCISLCVRVRVCKCIYKLFAKQERLHKKVNIVVLFGSLMQTCSATHHFKFDILHISVVCGAF